MKECLYRFETGSGHLAITVAEEGAVQFAVFEDIRSESAVVEVSAAELFQIGNACQAMAKLADVRKLEPR